MRTDLTRKGSRASQEEMRVLVALVASLMLATSCGESKNATVEPAPLTSPLAGATAMRVCQGEGSPIPQFALAVAFDSVWVACRARGQVLRLDLETGAIVARIPARGVVSLAAGDDAVWGVWREQGKVYRIDPQTNRSAVKATFLQDTPYIWAAGGTVWVSSQGTEIARLDPASGEVVARVAVGDGASDMLESPAGLLVICHRDSTLWRLDAAMREATLLGEIPGDTPERLALAGDTLWTAGRGTDLLELDPQTGKLLRTIEVGTGTIDLATAGDALWVAVAPPEADRHGLPELERLVRVDPQTGEIAASVVPTRQVDVTGLVGSGDGRLWVADVVAGAVLRVG